MRITRDSPQPWPTFAVPAVHSSLAEYMVLIKLHSLPLQMLQGLLLYMTELFQMKHGDDNDIDGMMRDMAQSKASPPPRASPRQGRQQPPAAISTPTRQHQPAPAVQGDQDLPHTSDKQIGTQQANPAAAQNNEEPDGQPDLVKQLKEEVERYTKQLAEQDQQIESLRKKLQVSALMP